MSPDLAKALDPGQQIADPAFRVMVQARIMARAERRRAWRKTAGYLAAGFALGGLGLVGGLLGLPPQLAPAAAVAAGFVLAFAAAPQYRRLPRLRF